MSTIVSPQCSFEKQTSGDSYNFTYYGYTSWSTILCLASASSVPNLTGASSIYDVLGSDSYYSSNTYGNKFYNVPFSPYSRDALNCFVYNPPTAASFQTQTINVTEQYNALMFYYDTSTQKTVYSKRGIICQSTAITQTVPTAFSKENLNASYAEYNTSDYSVKNPQTIISRTRYLFELYGCGHLYEEEYQNYAFTAPLDSRNPYDPTRNNGLNGKCGESGCFSDSFIDRNSDNVGTVHDKVFEAEKARTVAARVIDQCP